MRSSSDFDVVFDGRALLAEGPVWDVESAELYWVDILRREVHRWGRDTGRAHVHRVSRTVSALALSGDGGALVAAAATGFASLAPGTGELHELARAVPDAPRVRMNDGKCDPAGRFVAGSMTLDRKPGAAGLFVLDASLNCRRVLTGLTLANGLGWSPDGGTMYLVDTPTRRIDAFRYDVANGLLADRRMLVDLSSTPGLPDGLTVDAQGCVWVAMARGGGAVRRFAPDGSPLDVIDVPVAKVTSCTFGGPLLDELYITTGCFGLSEVELEEQPLAGAVLRIRPGVTGLPAHRFRRAVG